MRSIVRNVCLALLAAVPLWVQAADTPQQVVQHTVDTLLSDLKANRETYRSQPQTFYNALDRILGPVVDADGISRSVMTVRYSRQATPAQMDRFQQTFKQSLMQFYGNALLEYDNQDIRVLPASGPIDDSRTSVQMEITDNKGIVYPLSYTMEYKGDTWKVRNVIINGINIGKLFRDQFAQAMRDNRNDLDRVIDNWPNIVARARDTVEASSDE